MVARMMDDDNARDNGPPPQGDDEESTRRRGKDNASISSSSSSSSNDDDDTDSVVSQKQRDEVAEVQKLARKDNVRIRLWRLVATMVLLLTAVAVTLTTYRFLKMERTDNFETAYEQFARTVSDAAIAQQKLTVETYQSFAQTVSAYASTTGAQWPFFSMPHYEMYAHNVLTQSRTEICVIFPRVRADQVQDWIAYANATNQAWVEEGHMIRYGNLDRFQPEPDLYKPYMSGKPPQFAPDANRSEYWPNWNFSPPPQTKALINWNGNSIPAPLSAVDAMVALQDQVVVSSVRSFVSEIAYSKEEHALFHSKLVDSNVQYPHVFVYTPIHQSDIDPSSEIVGFLITAMAWDASLRDLLPANVVGIHAVIRNNCNQSYTYEIDGEEAFFKGEGDKHESKYDQYERVVDLSVYTNPAFTTTPGHCRYTMHVYPSSKFENLYATRTPEKFAGVVALTFVLVAVVFLIYDVLVQRRNRKLVGAAAQSNAIVSSMFPGDFRDRVIGITNSTNANNNNTKSGDPANGFSKSGPRHLKGFLDEVSHDNVAVVDYATKPLADLYLETTVMFADVVGFTAWSSVREPSQVFTLLESVYSSFDKIAKKRRVFKVETVGDCYVAVAGLPDPRKDHAVVMCRFARDVMAKMHVLTKELELTLGPDTGDLSLRVGIHSGPVTAGVLRGERARFQLFGDTMNTCARMESTGERGKIQLSSETAALLAKADKGNWVQKRKETVVAKGKGCMETFWLLHAHQQGREGSSDAGSHNVTALDFSVDEPLTSASTAVMERTARLIDWNTETLLRLIKQIVAHRNAEKEIEEKLKKGKTPPVTAATATTTKNATGISISSHGSVHGVVSFLDEVQEIIVLPEFDSHVAKVQKSPDEIQLSTAVTQQLREYVTMIASMYRNNPFHNFDHASHVIMSVVKLMSRIVAPSEESLEKAGLNEGAASLHDHTYGITSDPLTQFACAFSALIHDVDHTGVPNVQLIKEKSHLAAKYNDRSVAEQNSLEISWKLLMDPRFAELRAAIYGNEAERRRFRQLVVNSVMATDITDKDLKALRNARWAKAFSESAVPASHEEERVCINRKATIVIEHLIQASDVAHTMQHWHVYRKWNEKFFFECYQGFLAGRAETDPADFWYKGEIGFFDFYIIPLAKKLKDCGVFGKSSDEYLSYAMKNRQEWEDRGQEVVAEMLEKVRMNKGAGLDL